MEETWQRPLCRNCVRIKIREAFTTGDSDGALEWSADKLLVHSKISCPLCKIVAWMTEGIVHTKTGPNQEQNGVIFGKMRRVDRE
jgi:hypothetical protein